MFKLVSVLMCVHNEPNEFLKIAISSILNQTYTNFEFIIVNDCSNLECSNILKLYAKNDKRIQLYENKENKGLTESLNIGLSHVNGIYIARMDADDYSCYNRLEKQVKYLENHDDIDILGTGVVSFGNNNVYMSPYRYTGSDKIKSMLFYSSGLCHPSVMIRKSFLEKYGLGYDNEVKKAQDYDLWERSSVYGKLEVMNDVLLYYRIHDKQITSTNNKDQNIFANRTKFRRLQRIGIVPSEKDFDCHQALNGLVDRNLSYFELLNWSKRLIDGNKKYKLVDDLVFEKDIKERLLLAKLRNKMYGNLSLSDLLIFMNVFYSRICLKLALKRQIKKISDLGL